MADRTKIEWTRGPDGSEGATWNVINGCSVVSPGCTNCYAMRLAGTRMRSHPTRQGLTDDSAGGPVWNGQVRFIEQVLDQPLRWRTPRMIFVCAHGDLFHPAVPDEWIDRVFAVMASAPFHTFQVLTKRPERMKAWFERASCGAGQAVADYLSSPGMTAGRQARAKVGMSEPDPPTPELRLLYDRAGIAGGRHWRPWPLPNVWLGTSVEDQRRANERIPILLDTPAAVRWISAEPLLAEVNLEPWLDRLSWVVIGGESGPNARQFDLKWARVMLENCRAYGVPAFMKQLGSEAAGMGLPIQPRDPKGGDPAEWPADLRVRQYPTTRIAA